MPGIIESPTVKKRYLLCNILCANSNIKLHDRDASCLQKLHFSLFFSIKLSKEADDLDDAEAGPSTSNGKGIMLNCSINIHYTI